MATLEYGMIDADRKRRRRWTILAGVLVVFALVYLNDVREDVREAEQVTGSLRGETVWGVGFTAGWRTTPSPLEVALRRRGIPWTPRWRRMGHSTHSIIGLQRPVQKASDRAVPPAVDLRWIPSFDSFSDADLRALVNVMATGTEEQQREAVREAEMKVARMPAGASNPSPLTPHP